MIAVRKLERCLRMALVTIVGAWGCGGDDANGAADDEGTTTGTDSDSTAGGSVTQPSTTTGADSGPASSNTQADADDSSGDEQGNTQGNDDDSGGYECGTIVVDHDSIELFDQIPDEYKQAAAAIPMFYMDRSVGGNIDDGLSCLGVAHENAPNHCKRFEHTGGAEFSVDPSEVYWPGTWDRSNWEFQFWPDGCDEWRGSVDCFVAAAEARIDDFDVLSFQFSYLAVGEGSDIADPVDGFFGSLEDRGTADDYAAFAEAHPSKVVIWWTSSLARGIGSEASESFNDQMRQYAVDHEVILFDVADILAHDPDGNPCYDNRDGVPYSNGNQSENHPDDGLDRAAICQHYTTETEGGHLGSVSAGKIRVAKGFWVLMAQIAGWQPE